MDVCDTKGCGLQAVGACTSDSCGRLACRRHLIVGGSNGPRWTKEQYTDLFDSFDVLDGDRMREIWNADPNTLCLACRLGALLACRSDFVTRVEPALPPDDASTVVALRELKALFDGGWEQQMLEKHPDLHRAQFDQIRAPTFELVRARLAALEIELAEMTPDEFAQRWVDAAVEAGDEPVVITTGRLSANTHGWSVGGHTLSVNGSWYEPARVRHFSGGRAEIDGGTTVLSYRPKAFDPDDWAEFCSTLVRPGGI